MKKKKKPMLPTAKDGTTQLALPFIREFDKQEAKRLRQEQRREEAEVLRQRNFLWQWAEEHNYPEFSFPWLNGESTVKGNAITWGQWLWHGSDDWIKALYRFIEQNQDNWQERR